MVLVYTVILICPVLIGLAGVAIDQSYCNRVSTQLQSAADASALAAVGTLEPLPLPWLREEEKEHTACVRTRHIYAC
jgi:hypothetical protein